MLDIVSNEEAQKILKMKAVDSSAIFDEVTEHTSLIKVERLPSNFKGYPKDTKISYEPLTLGELESLNTGEIDVIRGVAMLLNSIHCNTMPVEELYYWDVMYIGIQRKLMAFGDTRGIIYEQCLNCGEILKREFDYTELEFKEIEAPDLPVITTINGVEVEIGLLTIKEFLELDMKLGELDVYARMIKNLPYNEAYDLISKCYGQDAKKIRYIDKKLNYGIKPFIEKCTGNVENPNFNANKQVTKNNPKTIPCEELVRMEVRSPFEVVFPEDEDTGYLDFEIQFGRK